MDQGLLNLAAIATYLIMGLGVVAALGVVLLRNLFHAALALAALLVATAAIFITLQADFLAMVQILIYVGAVMTLIIFAIMLTGQIATQQVTQNNKQSFIAFAAMIFFSVVLIFILFQTPWPVHDPAMNDPVTAATLGKSLLGEYVFPFEIISVILIAALIGAVTIAKKDSE